MTIQKEQIRKEIVKEVCKKLTDNERAVLWDHREIPLFIGPMDALRAIKERYDLTWCELRAVMHAA